MKKILSVLWLLLFSRWLATAADTPDMILFYWETCPHCKAEEWYIAELQEQYDFKLVWYEVYYSTENQELMKIYANKFGTTFNWVPIVIMWDDYFVWESKEKTENLVKKYAELKKIEKNTYWNTNVKKQEENANKPKDEKPEIEITDLWTWDDTTTLLTWTDENLSWDIDNLSWNNEDQKIEFLWKEISLKSVGPIVFGIILWFVDWINPCMFWVLIFLLTYLVSVGSKKKVLYSGLIFVITTFVLYYWIMYLMHNLLFSTMAILPYIEYIKYAIWWIAIILWIIEIKDFFAYGKWISLKIPAYIKPTLEYITKKGTYMSAFVLAVLSTFVELPCTIWIPLAYVWAVWDNINIFLALWIYNLFFVIPLLIIVFWIYWWLSAFKSDEDGNIAINDISSKKVMRLIAGIVLIALWILFILRVF